MNARTVSLAILAALATVPAFADTAQPGGLTREEVKAEYIRARNAGELDYANEFVTPHTIRKAGPSATSAAENRFDKLPPTAAGQRAGVTQPGSSDKVPG